MKADQRYERQHHEQIDDLVGADPTETRKRQLQSIGRNGNAQGQKNPPAQQWPRFPNTGFVGGMDHFGMGQ